MPVFAGEKELYQYSRNTKNPTFYGFINKFESQIAEWSTQIQASDPHLLHRTWVSRFNNAIRQTRNDISLKNTKYMASKWTVFFKDISLLQEFLAISRIEGQKVINKSTEIASERSLNLLQSCSNNRNTNPVDIENVTDDEETNQEEDNETTVDKLYKVYFKKLNGDEFTDEDIAFLCQVSKKKTSIKEKVHGIASQLLLKESLETQEDRVLELSLSSIVNILQPDSYDFYKKVFTEQEMTIIESTNTDLYVGLSAENEKLLKNIIESGGERVDVNSMMNAILTEQLHLNKKNLQNSDRYKALNVLRCMIENTQNSSEDDSEMTAYRHCARLLDYLFTGTGLKLLDGEPGCLSVKEDMLYNHSLYPSSAFSTNTLSTCSIKKIDAIVITQIQKNKVELSNNEWKKPRTTSITAIKQQSKNLRSNLSILNQLKHKYQIQNKSIFAMDFVGYHGYMYDLVEKENVYVPDLVEELILPTEIAEIKHAFKTINALFMLKNHLVNLSAEVAELLIENASSSKLKGIVRPRVHSISSSQTPRVIFSVNTKKRKTPS